MFAAVGVDVAAGIVKKPSRVTPSTGLSGRFFCVQSGSFAVRGMHIGYELDARTVGLSPSIVKRASGFAPPARPTPDGPIGSLMRTRVMLSMVTSPAAKFTAVM